MEFDFVFFGLFAFSEIDNALLIGNNQQEFNIVLLDGFGKKLENIISDYANIP